MDKSRKKYALKNISYNITSKIVTLILTFISRTVFIWVFGAEYLGINGLFSDVLNLLSMADLGFNIAMVYSFYQPLATNDTEKISALICFYRKVYIVIAIAVTCIGLLIIPVLPYLIKLDTDIPDIVIYYLISLANVVSSYICVYKTSILTADQKNYIIVRITLISNIIKTLLQIGCILIVKNYIVYLLIGLFITLFNNIYASRVASKTYPYINEKKEISSQEKKNIFKNIGSVFIFKISNVLMNATDNLLISMIVGTVAVGYYSNYFIIQTNVISFYALLFTSITASVGNLIVTEKAEKRYEIFKTEQSIGFIMAGIIVPCFVTLANDFINVWLGNNYVLNFSVIIAMGINMYLSCVLQPLWTFREATGLYRQTKWIMIICAVINIVLSYVLGKIFGIAGIIFASAASRLLTYIWYEPILLFRQYFERGVKKYYLNLILNLLLVSGICVICAIITRFIPVNNFALFFIELAVIFIVSVLLSFICYKNTSGIKMIRSIFEKKLLKK